MEKIYFFNHYQKISNIDTDVECLTATQKIISSKLDAGEWKSYKIHEQMIYMNDFKQQWWLKVEKWDLYGNFSKSLW